MSENNNDNNNDKEKHSENDTDTKNKALLLQDLIEIFADSPMDGQTLNKITTGLDAFGWKKVGTFPPRKWKGLH